MPQRSSRPPWAKELGFIPGQPLASSALRLRLTWLVFQDTRGNFVLLDPERPRPLGAESQKARPPTIYLATSSAEIEACGSAMLRVMEQNLIVGRREMALLDRVREAHRRLEGFVPAQRLPRVA
jgi:hypothetical protein